MAAPMDELDEVARHEIQQGWEVLDADEAHVGHVAEVHASSFAMESAVGTRLEIGFRDVESADAGTVTLAVSGDELTPTSVGLDTG